MSSKTSKPIEPLDSNGSQILSHLHPALLLSLYAFQFNAIVVDPVPALLNTLFITSAIQITYAVVCLPPTEGGSASAKKVVKKGFTKTKNESPSTASSNGLVVGLHKHAQGLQLDANTSQTQSLQYFP
jgi:GPI ethanolamine phosphate transferase 2/3 subunit F